MTTAKDLIGLKFPVQDFNGNNAGYKNITNCLEIENMAGFFIQLDDSESGLVISYKTAVELKENKNGT